MKNVRTRLGRMAFALILSLCMVVTMMPAMVWADDPAQTPAPGTEGNPIAINPVPYNYDENNPIVVANNQTIFFSLRPNAGGTAGDIIECQIFAEKHYVEEDDDWWDRIPNDEYSVKVYKNGVQGEVYTDKNNHYLLTNLSEYIVEFIYLGSSTENLYIYWAPAPGTDDDPMQVQWNKWTDTYKLDAGEAVYYRKWADSGTVCQIKCKADGSNIDFDSNDDYELTVKTNDGVPIDPVDEWYELTGDSDDTYIFKLLYNGQQQTQAQVTFMLVGNDSDDGDEEDYEDVIDNEGRIELRLDKSCGATSVDTGGVVEYSATFDKAVTCRISCTDKYQAALDSEDYTLTVCYGQDQALLPDEDGLYSFKQGIKYIIKLTYIGTAPNAVRVNTIEYKGNLPTNVSSTNAYSAINTGINKVNSELETYITNNPTKEFKIANPANLGGVEVEASENLLYYLGDIYKDEGIPFSRRWVQIDDPTSNKDSQSWDPGAPRDYSFVMHPYAVVYDVTKKAYLLCPKEDGLGGEKEYLYWSTEPCNFERAGKVPKKDRITDAAALWEEVQGDSFEIVYIARICIDIKEIDGDGLDACKYRAYRILGIRPFDFEMLDIQNDGVNELLEETSELRHEGWHYTDLRLINIRVQDFLIDDTLEARGKHMETFFGGLFKEKYYELVSDTAGLSIEAKVPRGDIGDVMIGVEEYQGNYWLNGQLYFMEELPHEGITYEDVMFVNPTENQTVAEAAETRLNNYLQGSGITATVEENKTELYLTEEGVIRKMEENEYYHNTGFIPTLQEIVDNGQFASMFEPSGQKTFDLYEWNEQAVIKTETLDIYSLYDVALSMEGEETKTYTMAIGKVDAETIAEKDREAYGYAEKGFNGGKFGTVRIDAQSGIIPFDIYMDAEETTVSNDRWGGNYAAIDITPGSNISTKADGEGVDGYSMKVTATGVKLGNTTLVAGDAFKVWDEEKGVYLTNANGSETFTVNSDNAVEFEATHFSKYAIVPTTETYREEYVPAKPVVPDKNPNIDVDPTSGEIVANLDDEIKVTDETASTVITKETAAEIAKSITENKSTEVKLDVTVKETAGESVTKTEVEVPMAIADAAGNNGASIEVATNVGSVVLDAKTVEGIAKTGADSFTIAVEKTDATNDKQAVFDITLESVKDGKSTSISKLKGSAQVVAPLPSGLVGEKICGLYLNGNLAEKVTTKVDGNKVTMTVKHFSTYAVMTDAAANKKFKKSAEKTTMGKLTLKTYKGGKIKASWKNGKGNTANITKYQVYYKQSGKKAKYTTTTSKSKTIKKLKKGKYYTMKVRARIKLNGKYYWSKWSSAKKIKCK